MVPQPDVQIHTNFVSAKVAKCIQDEDAIHDKKCVSKFLNNNKMLIPTRALLKIM
jgi:hypothetical protein